MITQDMVPQLVGRQAYDRDGKKIGEISQVYLDDHNGAPVWATVHTGLLGTKESVVPLASANVVDRDLTLAVSKDQVKDAPPIADSEDHISPEEEGRLHRHYGRWAGPQTEVADGHDRSSRDTAHGMTRSEERLHVGTETVQTGQVRLRKYVVTEDQQVVVPVRHEEVRVVREPVAAGDGVGRAEIGEQEQQVTLHAERPLVDTRTDAVETVRLATETVTGEETVSGSVRKERIEVDDPQNRVQGRSDGTGRSNADH